MINLLKGDRRLTFVIVAIVFQVVVALVLAIYLYSALEKLTIFVFLALLLSPIFGYLAVRFAVCTCYRRGYGAFSI
jgi:hypothetical protein